MTAIGFAILCTGLIWRWLLPDRVSILDLLRPATLAEQISAVVVAAGIVLTIAGTVQFLWTHMP